MIGTFKEGLEGFRPSTIMVWTDSINEIPPGWAICDGNNGTPNLQDKMFRGHGSSTGSPGNNGGRSSYTLSESQLPSHSHSFSTDETGSHNHEFIDRNSAVDDYDNNYSQSLEQHDFDQPTTTDGDHKHSFSTQNTGGNSSIDNFPQYVKVIYIQRL